jgi:hypothetical protein
MDLDKKDFIKLCSFIDDAKKNKSYEFEARIWNRNNKIINYDKYIDIFNKLTFLKKNNGLEYIYKEQNILDVILKNVSNNNFDSIRMSIHDTNNIKKYWLGTNIDNLDATFIEKEKLDKVDNNEYNIKFSLNNELNQNNLLKKNKDLLLLETYEKTFRLKNRYSIYTNDNLFVIDMTSVKMGKGNTFKDSNTLKAIPTYEVEIEYIGKNNSIETKIIVEKMLNHCNFILKILNEGNILLTNDLIENVKNYYNILSKNRLMNGIYENKFIAASPVTIHRENLFHNANIKNIYNNYCVTLKADGERHFLIVYSSDKDKENNGKIFIFNNNFEFLYTGYRDTEWCGTLIEAEYVKDCKNNQLYMYDILFSRNEDVRRKHLIDFKKDSSKITRLGILDTFFHSKTRIRDTKYDEKDCIIFMLKKYIQSVRSDGSDIFQKVSELWESKKYVCYNVDGIIFVPKYEYYPMYGGSWFSLFKWKPVELNTIDFLIKIVKNDNQKDIKSPYIEYIKRVDGKEETILKQYKTIELYVSGYKIEYKNQRKEKVPIPILFNPFNLEEKDSYVYNQAKVFIEADNRIYANDPITKTKEEIVDNIIVEFGYDITQEEGFRWKPYRFRRDKTNLYKSGKNVFGNSYLTANDIFKAINLPITEEMITTGKIPVNQQSDNLTNKKSYYLSNLNDNKKERFSYQNFHNHFIKYKLLYLTSISYLEKYTLGVHGKLLDLCCGKGVDINKIKRAKYAEVIGMDIDHKNIKEAQEYYKNFIPFPKPKASYFRGDAGKLIFPFQACGNTEFEKLKAKEYIPFKYLFDTISLQFCFHYFFKDEITLRTVIQNINDNLKIGGFFIGTTFDGQRIIDELKKDDFISGKTPKSDIMWKIEKKFKEKKLIMTDKKANYGKQIDVYVKTIGNVHPEYLVNFSFLDRILQEYGFVKIFVKSFKDFYEELIQGNHGIDLTDKELEKDLEVVRKMSEDEKRFSFLSNGFIYKKEKNSSDSLMKKLVDLMEKKDKVKSKKGVSKSNADTEHIIENTQTLDLELEEL